MAEQVPYGRVTQKPPAIPEIHILWMTSGLSCDGDTVSITAAMQPSIEDVILGAIPGLPKVHLHNPVLAYEVGGGRSSRGGRGKGAGRSGFADRSGPNRSPCPAEGGRG